uniref:ATP-grasp domain-containing protein n=1 Tax=mine drainage metagenome TaxID=410659 RepID=E6QMH2_9ZZZZ
MYPPAQLPRTDSSKSLADIRHAVSAGAAPLSVLIHATNWWPQAARLAMCFRDKGTLVYAIAPPAHPLFLVSHLCGQYAYDPSDIKQSLIRAIESSRAQVIVPVDDRAVWQLHDLAASHPKFRPLIERSLGSSVFFTVMRSRCKLLEVARSLAIICPETMLIENAQQLAVVAKSRLFPLVLKRDGTYSGLGVLVANSERQLMHGYRRMLRKNSPLRRWKSYLLDSDPCALFVPETLPPSEITLQEFIPGTPANALFACHQGAVVASMQVKSICSTSATGAALVVERIHDERILEAGQKLAAQLQISGFFGLDFILQAETGVPCLLELNPRATQLGHLALDPSGPAALASNGFSTLAEAMYRTWTNTSRDAPASVSNGSSQATFPNQVAFHAHIAFYPQSLMLGPESEILASAVLDRPVGEPLLLEDLTRPAWPQRRRRYRIYRAILSLAGSISSLPRRLVRGSFPSESR